MKERQGRTIKSILVLGRGFFPTLSRSIIRLDLSLSLNGGSRAGREPRHHRHFDLIPLSPPGHSAASDEATSAGIWQKKISPTPPFSSSR